MRSLEVIDLIFITADFINETSGIIVAVEALRGHQRSLEVIFRSLEVIEVIFNKYSLKIFQMFRQSKTEASEVIEVIRGH